MKAALCVIVLLAACLGPGRTACAQDQQPDERRPTLTWEQLARQANLAELRPKTEGEFRVDVLFSQPAQVSYVRAEIDLTAAEWARFTESGAHAHFFSSWTYGKVDISWAGLLRAPFSGGMVNVSKIPPKSHYIGLRNHIALESARSPDKSAGEYRLYLLVPGQDGKGGSLFYFFSAQRD